MNIDDVIAALADALKSKQAMMATAESCTGGGVAYNITSMPGSSHWYDRGFVVYTNESKTELLDVKPELIKDHGAVSEAVACALAEGAIKKSHAHYALAITGIAGPGGGTEDKPVGTVWFAWAGKGRETVSNRMLFVGDRQQVRQQAVSHALAGMLEFIVK